MGSGALGVNWYRVPLFSLNLLIFQVDSLDPFGEKNALRELGLAKGASQEEIRTKYRELSKVIKNH